MVTFLPIDHELAGPAPRASLINDLARQAYRKYGERGDAVDRARLDAVAAAAVRHDAAAPNQGYFLARELEQVYAEVLAEPRPMQNAFALFPVDSSVSPAADTHTIKRVYGAGKAASYRGRGTDIPSVSVSKREESFKVDRIVTSFSIDIWEQMASGLANANLLGELMRTARDVVEAYINLQSWYGSTDKKLPGALTYPWLRKRVITEPFNSSGTPLAIVAALHDLVNYAYLTEKQTFKPNKLAMSPRVRSHLAQTQMSVDNPRTILETFVSQSAHIASEADVVECWELQNDDTNNPIPGLPAGLDGILAFRNDRMGVQNTIPQGFTTMSPQMHEFEEVTYCWASHAGVIMRQVGNNILGFVTPPDQAS